MRVAHRSTRARIDEATDAEIRVVAIGLRDALAALHNLLGDVPYNVVIRTAPPGSAAGEYHWHADVLPRTTLVAGFEEGTGLLVNTVAPEHGRGAAARGGGDVTVEVRLCETIGVTPDAVWAAMEDIETHTEWMADAVAITFRTDQRTGVGTEFECLTRIGPFTTTDVMTVTEWRPGIVMGIEHRGVVTGVGRSRCTRWPAGSPSCVGTSSSITRGGWVAPWVNGRADPSSRVLARQPRPLARQSRTRSHHPLAQTRFWRRLRPAWGPK